MAYTSTSLTICLPTSLLVYSPRVGLEIEQLSILVELVLGLLLSYSYCRYIFHCLSNICALQPTCSFLPLIVHSPVTRLTQDTFCHYVPSFSYYVPYSPLFMCMYLFVGDSVYLTDLHQSSNTTFQIFLFIYRQYTL